MLSVSLYLVHEHCILPRLEAAEKTDAGRVAPISACVFYQIDRLKSGFEAMGRTVMPRNCALMGATRLASGHFSAASLTRQPVNLPAHQPVNPLTRYPVNQQINIIYHFNTTHL